MSSLAFESVSETPSDKPRRKAVLQWLLLAVLVGCFFFVLWANREARALARYKRLGARFSYLYTFPSWLPSRALPVVLNHTSLFRELDQIDLTASRVQDSDLSRLQHIPDLKRLILYHTEITDAGLKSLYPLKNLTYVNLSGTQVTSEGIESLRRTRPKLHINTQDLNHLVIPHRMLPQVATSAASRLYWWSIDFSDTRDHRGKKHPTAGDADVKRAAKLMKDIPRLRSINLSSTGVTDAGLRFLEDLTQLERLDLSDTNVTDDGLRHLTALTDLKEIDLRNTRVTDEGAAWLHTELPEVTLSR